MINWIKATWNKFFPRKKLAPSAADGARGEQAAANFLKSRHGYSVVVRNWRNPRDRRDEIDLVCLDREVLVFVEVKARAEGALVSGYQAIDERKKRALCRAVHAYLGQLKSPPRSFRFDVVDVTLSVRLPPQVLHYENVPLFPKGYYVARQSGSLGDVSGDL